MSRLKAYIKPFSLRARVAHQSTFSNKALPNSTHQGSAESGSTRTDYSFSRTAPKERAHVRLPIIINGAGPAGLLLAIGLKNARIPFEICERHRHDLPSKLRRNHASLLSDQMLVPLRKFLKARYENFLPKITIAPLKPRENLRRDHPIHTEAFLDLLRGKVPVNYGFTLHRDGISCRESVVTSQYVAGHAVRTLRGSLLVGADGMFSSVRNTFNVSAWPAVTYASAIVISKQQFESDFGLDDMTDGGSSTRLIGNTRFMLSVNGMTRTHVNLTLWYSRMIASNEDYQNFWGYSPEERDILRVEYQFDPMIKDEIDSLLPLPPPFNKAYELCKSIGISQKLALNCVRTCGRELTTEICRNGMIMPAVLIGDAAHAVPEIFSPADINRTLWDAIDLCTMIVDRYEDDKLFSTIVQDFYASKSVKWQKFPREWARSWMEAHGLPSGLQDDRLAWVKLRRTVRREDHGNQSELNPDDFPQDRQRAILQYKKGEAAFHPQPGIQSSEIVMRYLDSRPIAEHDEPKVVGDHASRDKGTTSLDGDNNESP